MATAYVGEPEIAQRLQEVHSTLTKRLKNKWVFLRRAVFNKAAGRNKVEDSVYLKVARLLRRRGLLLLRFEAVYVLVSEETLESWPAPRARETKAWTRTPARKRAASVAKTALSPQAAWPFPTGSKP